MLNKDRGEEEADAELKAEMVSVLTEVTDLLYKCNEATVRIPISALKHLSKIDQEAVSKIAPSTAPRSHRRAR